MSRHTILACAAGCLSAAFVGTVSIVYLGLWDRPGILGDLVLIAVLLGVFFLGRLWERRSVLPDDNADRTP